MDQDYHCGMNPDSRKARSEAVLAACGIEINLQLPPFDPADAAGLRSPDEVLQRLIVLWAVAGKAMIGRESQHASYIIKNKMQPWLSTNERKFILDKQPSKRDIIHFSWQLESLFFVAWCAGLLEVEDVPVTQSSVQPILALFPQIDELPDRLRGAFNIRPLAEILDRADLLYRLHWAARDEFAASAEVDGAVVHEWRRAINWMLRLGREDDWDKVGADTGSPA